MKALREHLKTVYEKHEKAYNELAEIDAAIKKNLHKLPSALQTLLPHLRVLSYRNEQATIAVPEPFFSAEIYFYADILKKIIGTHTKQRIRAVRFVPS